MARVPKTPDIHLHKRRIQTMRNSADDDFCELFTLDDDPFDDEFEAPYFGLYGVGPDGLLDHIADRRTYAEAIELARNLVPGVAFSDVPILASSPTCREGAGRRCDSRSDFQKVAPRRVHRGEFSPRLRCLIRAASLRQRRLPAVALFHPSRQTSPVATRIRSLVVSACAARTTCLNACRRMRTDRVPPSLRFRQKARTI